MNDIEDIITAMGQAYVAARSEWVRLEDIAQATGLTAEELAAGVREMMKEDHFRAEPQPFGWRITDWDRANAPVIGGEARHLISRE
jgi:hypothetical protein